MRYYYFLKESGYHINEKPILPAGYTVRIWKPKGLKYFPDGMEFLKRLFATWFLMSKFRLFKNNDLSVCLIYYGDTVAHFSVTLPPFFKVPFLDKQDLQIGPVWTHDEHRKKGFAFYAINKILEEYGDESRKFWYITRSDNIPSIKTCEKAGFIKYAEGEPKSKLPLGLLQKFSIDKIFNHKNQVIK
ncbi:GNAT family N-acetyltransferase [candidate division KSB1 bacterium]|nr:GNAT family N-acetyltransferase [candidate division KSB1 bacterium]